MLVAAVAGVPILAGLLAAAMALRSDEGSSQRDLAGRQEAGGLAAAPASAALQEALAWVGGHVRPGTQVVVPDGVAGPAGALVTTYREAGSAVPSGLLVNAGKPPADVAALTDRSVPLPRDPADWGAARLQANITTYDAHRQPAATLLLTA